MNINLKGISEHLLKIFKPLFKELEYIQQPLDKLEFIDAAIRLYEASKFIGGDLSQPTLVTEQYLLDLEREAFLSLCGQRKTLERLQSILTTGKPLRN